MIEVKTNKSSIDFVVDHLHDNLMSHLCEVLSSSNVFCASTKIETHTLYRDVVGKKRDYVGKIPKLGGGGSDPNPLLDVYLPSYFWHAKMAPNQSCMPLVVKKNGNMWETFPTEGGVTYSQRNCFLWGQNCDFLVKTKNVPEVLK